MPDIKNEVLINAPINTVYQLAREVEKFPEYMPDIESVVVRERSQDGNRTITEWVGMASEVRLKLRWTEEDVWDPDTYTCQFTQLKGDYQEYSGVWKLTEEDGKTKFSSDFHYEYEVPLIGPLIKALIAKLARTNMQNVLEAIKIRSEQQ